MDLKVTAGSLDGFDDTSAAISRTAADRLGVDVGGELRLVLGDGHPAAVRIAAIYARGLGFGDLTLSHRLVAGHVDDPRSTVLVSGGDREALRRALPGVTVLDQATAAEETGTPNAAVTYVAMGPIIAFCAISVVNTLAMSTMDRAKELALLRRVGTTRRQAARMLRTETLTATTVAVVIGTAISLVTLVAFSTGMTGSPHGQDVVAGVRGRWAAVAPGSGCSPEAGAGW
jgi:putative ABC transport system permease protein